MEGYEVFFNSKLEKGEYGEDRYYYMLKKNEGVVQRAIDVPEHTFVMSLRTWASSGMPLKLILREGLIERLEEEFKDSKEKFINTFDNPIKNHPFATL